MPHIVLDQVSKSYGSEKALDAVSARFADQATTALVGPSGSGKSTLLQMINGLARPSAGAVLVFGAAIDYGRLPELRRRIGYAVQGTGLFPHMTVERNMTLLAHLAGWDVERIDSRARDLMERVGLPWAFATRYPHQLSGGQQQRVGLCRAMFLEPPLLLLDEPFGALDPVTRREIHEEFLRLQEAEPRTMILVTHDVAEAMRLAQRVIVLEHGRIVQHDTTDAIRAAPANDFVRRFLGEQHA